MIQLYFLRAAAVFRQPLGSVAVSITGGDYHQRAWPSPLTPQGKVRQISLPIPSRSSKVASWRSMVATVCSPLPIMSNLHNSTLTLIPSHSRRWLHGCSSNTLRFHLPMQLSGVKPHIIRHSLGMQPILPSSPCRAYSRLFRNVSRKRQQRGRTIRAEKFVLIDENGANIGVMDKETALKLAEAKGLEIIQVQRETPDSRAVCKLLSRKELWYHEKREKEKNRKDPKSVVKQVVTSVNIAEHDLATKVQHMCRFLEKQHSVELVVETRARRELQRQAERKKQVEMIGEVARQLEGVGVRVETTERIRGRRMIVMFKPVSM